MDLQKYLMRVVRIDFQDCYQVSYTFYVLVYLYYTLYLINTGMNQHVDMNPLMICIYRAAVSAFA